MPSLAGNRKPLDCVMHDRAIEKGKYVTGDRDNEIASISVKSLVHVFEMESKQIVIPQSRTVRSHGRGKNNNVDVIRPRDRVAAKKTEDFLPDLIVCSKSHETIASGPKRPSLQCSKKSVEDVDRKSGEILSRAQGPEVGRPEVETFFRIVEESRVKTTSSEESKSDPESHPDRKGAFSTGVSTSDEDKVATSGAVETSCHVTFGDETESISADRCQSRRPFFLALMNFFERPKEQRISPSPPPNGSKVRPTVPRCSKIAQCDVTGDVDLAEHSSKAERQAERVSGNESGCVDKLNRKLTTATSGSSFDEAEVSSDDVKYPRSRKSYDVTIAQV